jgi:23S rRNA (guanine745-N1)-methyltransferase
MIYTCPVCGKPLETAGNSYKCSDGHSFDKARSGYVNLLLSKHIGKTIHGDNKLMVRARREFLEKGYYQPLRDALCKAVKENFSGSVLLDAGCGEGYYTSAVSGTLGTAAEVYGIDISKIAAEFAAKRHDGVNYAAGSVFHIPVADASCDMLITLFSPYCGEEFVRVLRNGGVMIMAIPSTDHLWELKQKIYDTPYKNEVKPYELEGFSFIGKEHIRYMMELASQEDIQQLFSMTPYYYRTGQEQQKRLEAIDRLNVTADFELLIYKNNSN